MVGQAQPSDDMLAPYTLTLPSRIGQTAHLVLHKREGPGPRRRVLMLPGPLRMVAKREGLTMPLPSQ